MIRHNRPRGADSDGGVLRESAEMQDGSQNDESVSGHDSARCVGRMAPEAERGRSVLEEKPPLKASSSRRREVFRSSVGSPTGLG